ncbi:hypothetical protein KBY70_06185 [Cyanobium sp. ATX 6E8]|uniref:hypothetical protein n=1 Tax=Cyanobium sp. ATX 6E8 TaxID=2823701 RepID=UPI0020CCABD1|nr:hypothetical protein [Cyanobium sp. ATX 6E8]MCP9941976.1 hypothetical protein [Cyanobium sp. ATX 6E8]
MGKQGNGEAIANGLTSAELKRRGIAAIEEALEHGPVHLIKRNKAAAVVLTEQHYQHLQQQAVRAPMPATAALHWLLEVPPSERPRSKAAIDSELVTERDW